MTATFTTAAAPATDLAAPAFLARLRGGDEDAFAVLVRATSARLLAVARRMLGNEDDARDALQDAWLAAHRALPDFRGSAQLSTWLHRIVVNAALMKLRSRRRRPEAPLETLLPGFDAQECREEEAAVSLPDAERVLASHRTLERIRRAADRLPPRYREIFLLRDVEDLDTAEAAALLGVSEGVVKIRLHRARQALRTLLAREFGPRAPARAVRRPARADAGPWLRSAAADFGMLGA